MNSITKPIALVAISILLSACAQSGGAGSFLSSNGPSEAQVQAVLKAAYQRPPVEPTFGYMLDGVSNVSVEILRRGEFNEAQKFLPVQARITADVRQKAMWVPPGKPQTLLCKYSVTKDFKIVKNDYGDWTATAGNPFIMTEPQMRCGQ